MLLCCARHKSVRHSAHSSTDRRHAILHHSPFHLTSVRFRSETGEWGVRRWWWWRLLLLLLSLSLRRYIFRNFLLLFSGLAWISLLGIRFTRTATSFAMMKLVFLRSHQEHDLSKCTPIRLCGGGGRRHDTHKCIVEAIRRYDDSIIGSNEKNERKNEKMEKWSRNNHLLRDYTHSTNTRTGARRNGWGMEQYGCGWLNAKYVKYASNN